VLKAMFASKLKLALAVLFVPCMVGVSRGSFAHQALAQKPGSPKQEASSPKAGKDKDKKEEGKAEDQPDLNGIIAAVSNDRRTITMDLPPQIKGDAPTSVEIKLTDKTKLVYFGVDGNGETPTVGYSILVWLAKDSKDTAAAVKLGRKDGLDQGKGPDFSGHITAVSKDAKSITVEVAPENKGDEPKRLEIKLTDKTKFSYFGVDQAGQTPTVGYAVLVWLVKDSKDTAAGVRLGLKN
jgi:hypothetical protein